MAHHRFYLGDSLEVLKTFPSESVNCCVTSPPYFYLRDYGIDGQIGLEPTPAEYVDRLVQVFREVRRVLRDDGVAWVNLGDSYCSGMRSAYDDDRHKYTTARAHDKRPPTPPGLKPKDLIGIPWRVAFALQAEGWYLRSDIIWAKPNAMPESVTDRPTRSHEYIFLLAKSERYWYDHEAIKEPGQDLPAQALTFKRDSGKDTELRAPGQNNPSHRPNRKQDEVGKRQYTGFNERWDNNPQLMRNKRDVWTVATVPFPEAHYAVFPPALIEPCILAGCPPGGVVLDPFGGAGTTSMVSMKHNRNSIYIDLNSKYKEMALRRCGFGETLLDVHSFEG
jgi:DNA modification methylase